MNEVLNVQTGPTINVIKIVTTPGPDLKRPRHTYKKKDVFTPQLFKNGNVMYTCNTFSLNVPVENSMGTIDFAEHVNGSVFKINYNGVNFIAPSLYSIGCMGTSAVFDLQKGEKAGQRKITEIGNKDVPMSDEISDIAADDRSVMITTKMMSESTPGSLSHDVVLSTGDIVAGRINMNTGFVSDIIHTKKIEIVDDGIVDYYVRVNIPAKHSHGIVEVLSGTFLNDIMIHLIKNNKKWALMGDETYTVNPKTTGFVIAKDPNTAMGLALIEWPRGAVLYPPVYKFAKFKTVNKWSICQQFGSMLNTSVKIPGGEYSWRIRLFFGPIWRVQENINFVQTIPHGNEYKYLYHEDYMKFKQQKKHKKNFHEYDYDYK